MYKVNLHPVRHNHVLSNLSTFINNSIYHNQQLQRLLYKINHHVMPSIKQSLHKAAKLLITKHLSTWFWNICHQFQLLILHNAYEIIYCSTIMHSQVQAGLHITWPNTQPNKLMRQTSHEVRYLSWFIYSKNDSIVCMVPATMPWLQQRRECSQIWQGSPPLHPHPTPPPPQPPGNWVLHTAINLWTWYWWLSTRHQ